MVSVYETLNKKQHRSSLFVFLISFGLNLKVETISLSTPDQEIKLVVYMSLYNTKIDDVIGRLIMSVSVLELSDVNQTVDFLHPDIGRGVSPFTLDNLDLPGQLADRTWPTARHEQTVVTDGATNILLCPHLNSKDEVSSRHTARQTDELIHVFGHLHGQAGAAEPSTETYGDVLKTAEEGR